MANRTLEIKMQKLKNKSIVIIAAITLAGIGLIGWRLLNADHIERRPKSADYSDRTTWIKKTLATIPDSDPKKLMIAFEDVRSCDLSDFDLTRLIDWLDFIWFDNKTRWPRLMPPGFSPGIVMEIGKDPGLGIRALQKQGLDGHGVSVAMIDSILLTQHVEYRKNLRWYEELIISNQVDEENTAQMHGPAMASLAIGKTVGVAPGAELYFIACDNIKPYKLEGARISQFDYTRYAKAIDRILEINKRLSLEKKIRAISISAAWSPEMEGYQEMTRAVKRAVDQGIFVLSPNTFETYDNRFYYQVLDRDPLGKPDDLSIFSVIPWDRSIRMVKKPRSQFDKYYEEQFDRFADVGILLVPINSRTVASPTGTHDYAFHRQGGWSGVQPFLCGLFAIACQVKPDITPALFWQKALETGIDRDVIKGDRKYPGKIVNPTGLIKGLQDSP